MDGCPREGLSLEHVDERQKADSYSANLDKRSALTPTPTSECERYDHESDSHCSHCDCGVAARF